MKIDRFGFQKKFSVNTTFLDETLMMEGSLEEGETWEEATLKGRKRMIALVESYAPDGVKLGVSHTQPSIIDKSFEKLEIAIDNAKTLADLQFLRGDIMASAPSHIVAHFVKKHEELSKNI